MNNIGPSTFAAIFASMPDARVELRAGADTISRALSAGRTATRQDSDMGAYDGVAMVVRLESASESPRNKLTVGRVVEVKQADDDAWVRVRIAARKEVAGLVQLTMEYPNE